MAGNRVFSRSIPVAGNAITQQIMREFDLSFADAEDVVQKVALTVARRFDEYDNERPFQAWAPSQVEACEHG